MLIIALTFTFAILKLEHMAQRKNPQISTNLEAVDYATTYDLG